MLLKNRITVFELALVALSPGVAACASEPMGTLHLASETWAINLSIWEEAWSWTVTGDRGDSGCGEKHESGGELLLTGLGMSGSVRWPLGDGTVRETCSVTGKLLRGNLELEVIVDCVPGRGELTGPVTHQRWKAGMTCADLRDGKIRVSACDGHLPEPPESCYRFII